MGYLITNIECVDSDVKVVLVVTKLDNTATGLQNDFKRAVAYLIPVDPLADIFSMVQH